MHKKLFILITILFVFFLALPAFAQDQAKKPTARLVYFDDEYEIEVFHPDGTPYDYVDWDMELPEGTTIKTHNSTAELRLDPNGSIIKLSTDTQFSIEGFQTGANSANSFTLLAGKLRTIAAHSGKGENYSIQTPSAVCGVRGTDFGLQALAGVSDAVAVLQGTVEFINTATGQSIQVAAGHAADVFGQTFAPFSLNQDEMLNLFQGMGFQGADPSSVPGNEALSTIQQALQPQGGTEPAPSGDQAPPPSEPQPQAGTQESQPSAPSEPSTPQRSALSPVFDFLGRFLGMQLGTISIDGRTYAKAVFLPKLEIGKFRMALYLPIIYSTDMFNPADWYRPEGNDEWSFGTDQSGTLPILKDILRDVALKIKYIEYGDNRDPFFFKLGNIESITLGHGLLMRNFPADAGFPAVRHIGFNGGLDFKAVGFEAMIADFAVPEIMGGRLYFRPAYKSFPFAIGLSSIVDTNPAGQVVPAADGTIDTYGNPLFITGALDLDFPIIDTDFLSIVLFADGGGLIPYYREAYAASGISPGFAASALYTGTGGFTLDSLNNMGASAGVLGNISIVDYRLDFRYSKGIFSPSFFSTSYARNRGSYVADFARYMADPTAAEFQTPTLGIYGEAGVKIGKIGTIQAGYLWPMSITDTGITTADTDMFHLQIVLFPKVIPVVGVHGSLTFDRTHFVQTLAGGKSDNLSLFDAYTTVSAELAVPVGPVLEVAVIYTTSTAYDDNGNVIADELNANLPKVYPSVSIETRVNF